MAKSCIDSHFDLVLNNHQAITSTNADYAYASPDLNDDIVQHGICHENSFMGDKILKHQNDITVPDIFPIYILC